ncbi:hypothetical protein COAQ111491_17690 [Comamonas aquatilis]
MENQIKQYGAPKWWESYIGAPILLAIFLGGLFIAFLLLEHFRN